MTPNPLIAELMSHKWAMEEIALKAFFEQMNGWSPEALKLAIDVKDKPKGLTISDGIAVIKISGVLLKSASAWLRFWGIENTGYDEIVGQLREALDSEEVTGIHLQVSSPGGVVDGLVDVADAILAARSQKPVTATIEDLGASAAYWLTSQAETIEAGRTAEVGSIGVYTVYMDMTKRAEELGFKVIVIKSGEHKGMGVPGAEITNSQIEAVQEVVDQIADSFISAVAAGRGRKKSEVKEWASGRTWIAKTALDMGLIDKVTVNKSQNQNNGNIKGDQNMDDQKQKDEQAEAKAKSEAEREKAVEQAEASERDRQQKLLMEFKAAFPDDLEFAIDACGRGLSVTEAKAERYDTVNKQLKEQTKKTEKDQAKEKTTGAKAISTEDTDDEGQNNFVTAAKELAKTKKIKLGDAYKRIAREQPELYEAHMAKLGLQRTAVA